MTTILGTYPRKAFGAAFAVFLVIVVQTWLMGIAIIGFDILLLVALVLWFTQSDQINQEVSRFYFFAIAVQCFHLSEEFSTGFQHKFPQFFGYEWGDQQFIIFNLVWLAILILNGVWLTSKSRLSYLLVYFAAVGVGIANGIGHLLLSFFVRGYFPGLITAPLVLIVGIVLFRKLIKSG